MVLTIVRTMLEKDQISSAARGLQVLEALLDTQDETEIAEGVGIEDIVRDECFTEALSRLVLCRNVQVSVAAGDILARMDQWISTNK